ncbi:hypothetical protein MKEN_01125600 [Mycena kentingensis (nom. inval.)]|nr:hypothetical protein MKEN_01125600 [Mycena kentingensis (nom. inval.)]
MAPSSSPIRPLPSPPPLAVQTDWPGYLPKSRSSVDLISPHSDSSSSPDTPVDPIPELELRRRRQLDKAARILGETLPLDAVWNRATTPNLRIRAFPEPPPRRSTTDAPQSGQSPREVLTERSAVTTTTTTRRPGKIARRASISLATFALKLRGGGTHIRGSSQESQAQSMTSSSSSASSPSSPGERSTPSPQPTGITRRRSAVLTSPILFAFPGRTKSTHHARPISPPWPRSTPSPAPTLDFDPVGDSLNVDPDLILDIGPDLDLDDDDHESDLETPVVEHPTSTASRILQHKPSTSEIFASNTTHRPHAVPWPFSLRNRFPNDASLPNCVRAL